MPRHAKYQDVLQIVGGSATESFTGCTRLTETGALV